MASSSGRESAGERKGAPPARRSLGQHFLVDRNIQRRIVEEANIQPGDTVVEIGPGRGALTSGLAEVAHRLVLVEVDRALAQRLRTRFADRDEITVLEEDILKLTISELGPDPRRVKVVGNIPYNLTTPIIFHVLARPRPAEALLMVQREVAARILAEPGTGEFGALSVGVRAMAEVDRVLPVPSGAFRPRPRVESEVIRIRPLDPPPLNPSEEEALRTLTRALFQWRRKQLRRILRDHGDLKQGRDDRAELLEAAGARPTDRPETVAVEGFREMARVLARRH